jgi:hypothetical protein
VCVYHVSVPNTTQPHTPRSLLRRRFLPLLHRHHLLRLCTQRRRLTHTTGMCMCMCMCMCASVCTHVLMSEMSGCNERHPHTHTPTHPHHTHMHTCTGGLRSLFFTTGRDDDVCISGRSGGSGAVHARSAVAQAASQPVYVEVECASLCVQSQSSELENRRVYM